MKPEGLTMRNATQDGQIKFVPVRPIDSEAMLYKYSHDLKKRIADRAYQIFEHRGEVPGHDVDDWLKAESEIVWELH